MSEMNANTTLKNDEKSLLPKENGQPYNEGVKNQNSTLLSIEDRALPSWTLRIALEEMKEYRSWEDTTCKAYLRDVDCFEDFSLVEGFEPTLEKIKLHHVQKYMKHTKETKVAYNTTKRVIAFLSSVFSFYQSIGTIRHNPFKASNLPVGEVGHHSRALELEEIVDVYEAIDLLKNKEGMDLSVTIGVLFFTGLRNHALSKLIVKDVWFDQELIHYDPGVINNKHEIQYFPIPPKLKEMLKNHIEVNQLQPEDQLLQGIKGLDLQNKQLNRITNKINNVLGWVEDKHVTPHGYRASIATILDERGLERDNIKYLLGHAITKDNITQYLRRDTRKIRALRVELTKIEDEIYEELHIRRASNPKDSNEANINVYGDGQMNESQQHMTDQPKMTMQDFVELTKINPQLAQKLAAMNLVSM